MSAVCKQDDRGNQSSRTEEGNSLSEEESGRSPRVVGEDVDMDDSYTLSTRAKVKRNRVSNITFSERSLVSPVLGPTAAENSHLRKNLIYTCVSMKDCDRTPASSRAARRPSSPKAITSSTRECTQERDRTNATSAGRHS